MLDENFSMNEVGIVQSNLFARTINGTPWRWKEDDIIHVQQENFIILEMEREKR